MRSVLCDKARLGRSSTAGHRRGLKVHASRVPFTSNAPCAAPSTSSAPPACELSRRALLATATSTAVLAQLAGAQLAGAFEWAGLDVARKVLRPDGEEQKAIVALMDARSTLKDMAQLAATPLDSEERFRSRYIWPSYAKYLREVATSAPIVAQAIAGDKEKTLSEKYGGTSEGAGLTDGVFEAIGQILTLSGRTIRKEAQEDPAAALQGVAALSEFLANLPEDKLDAAQQFRVQRAGQA